MLSSKLLHQVSSPCYASVEVEINITPPGIIDPGFMITSRIPLADVVSRGILKLLHDPGSDVKILVDLGIL